MAVLFLLASSLISAQLVERQNTSVNEAVALVDEDEETPLKKNYVFNPILAKKELKVGNFYAKKGKHKAAAARYQEATRWNPGYSHAYWKLGKSHEKLKSPKGAIEAYRRYLSVAPQGKHAKTIRIRITSLTTILSGNK